MPDLAALRDEIQQCETFLSLCERIRKLEKLEESNALPMKIRKLQEHMSHNAREMEVASKNVQHNEAALNSKDRPIGSAEQEERGLTIRMDKARIRTLQINTEETTKQIKLIEQEIQYNSQALEQSYEQLERAMQTDGLHPNTVSERLANLRSQEEKFRLERKANIALRNTQKHNESAAREAGNRSDPRGRANVTEPSIPEAEFRQKLIDDLRSAKKSVVIMSKFLSVEQAAKIMPELIKLAAQRMNILIYTAPPEEHTELMKLEALSVITTAHRAHITVILRTAIDNSGVIIDDYIAWEGDCYVLGPPQPQSTMRRTTGGQNARQLRNYISAKPTWHPK
jgi:hypothetical protein